jgi:predicted transcriptional regulator
MKKGQSQQGGAGYDATLEEMEYHLYVQQKVRRGIRDVEEGRVHTQQEVEKRMKKWVSE